MPHLVAAPDKFRGTATAVEVVAAVTAAADAAGWSSMGVPLSDGGEGLLEALGGAVHRTEVPGPLGAPTIAEWRMLPATDRPDHPDHPEHPGPTAVIEMSRAAGRALLPHPRGDEPVRADTAGVGTLLLAARDAGARRIVVGCGGSATTDGGWGAVRTVGSAEQLDGIEITVACDVTTPFRQAARVFGPQKGATAPQIALLSDRLGSLADRYRRDFGVDVDAEPGAGAAGGLAGGLVALGARLVHGFDLVAGLVDLDARLAVADMVITGEGHLDPPSFRGKVPGGVLSRVGGRCPVLCICGGADPALLRSPPTGMEVVSLTERFGRARARAETTTLIEEVTAAALDRFCP
jgi:glycerate 2-kinase